MKRILLYLMGVLLVFPLSAQQSWHAEVEPVKESGYYNIELDQRIIGAARYELSNLKLLTRVGEDVEEVPYFVRSAERFKQVLQISDYTLRDIVAKDSINSFIVDNKELKRLSTLYAIIGDTDVLIDATVYGGNNLKDWFIVKATGQLKKIDRVFDGELSLTINFPEGKYRYYKVILNNHQNSPLDLKRVVDLTLDTMSCNYDMIEIGEIKRTKSGKGNTLLSFPEVKNVYAINKLVVTVEDPAVYHRNVLLKDTLRRDLFEFYIASDRDNKAYLEDFKLTKHSQLEIINKNNPELKQVGVQFYGIKRYICAYLERDKVYELTINQDDNRINRYDIEYFKDKIGTDIPLVKCINVTLVKESELVASQKSLSFFEGPTFMWSVIVAISLLLLYICFSLITKMNKK